MAVGAADAPGLEVPVALEQPTVLYEFADPALEARSSDQKILIRMGRLNALQVKAKLTEIPPLLVKG